MSAFLERLVRSEAKSCAGKNRYSQEASALRAAYSIMVKKANGEIFETYECVFCNGWHIGHRTSTDWIPRSHKGQTLVINEFVCIGNCDSRVTRFLTGTVFSNRILEHFPAVKYSPEVIVKCPVCRSPWVKAERRKFIPLDNIPVDSKATLEDLWAADEKVKADELTSQTKSDTIMNGRYAIKITCDGTLQNHSDDLERVRCCGICLSDWNLACELVDLTTGETLQQFTPYREALTAKSK